MDGYTFTRWTRFGHDRLYVSRDDGGKVGHVDLATGIGSPEPGNDREHLELLVQVWQTRQGHNSVHVHRSPDHTAVDVAGPSDAQATALVPEPAPQQETETEQEPQQSSQDLGLNRAGSAARAKATEEWDAYRERRPIASRIAKLLDLDTPDKSWARGAEGEVEVGRRLEKLTSEGWRVLHAVPVGKNAADIDHLLIGPAGVFCINTKNHSHANVWVSSKVIMVNGKKTDHLRNSRFEAKRVSTILTTATGWRIDAQPLLAIMARQFTVRSKPDDVFVVGRKELPRWFHRRPAIYSTEAVERIYEIARHGETWQP